ncbi:MAG: hypothetical protein R3B13_13355 [Polyangiaceae bacterium]
MRVHAFIFAVLSLTAACSSSKGSGGGATGGTAGAGAGGTGGGGGASGGGGVGANGGGGGAGAAGTALPATTFLFERRVDANRDHLIAMDYATGQERIVSTLVQPNSDGWNIDGVAVSPDRTRIVLASPYGPTQQDTLTGIAAQRLWSMNTEGGDMVRLTPVFEGGVDTTKIDVRNPVFTPDGLNVFYEYGEYNGGSWYVAPWWVGSGGNAVPSLFQTQQSCSINNNPAVNPVTGDLLLKHTVCLPSVKGGYYLYPAAGGTPTQLVDETGSDLRRPVFSFDGSAFLFTARSSTDQIQSLYLYLLSTQQLALVISGSQGVDVVDGSFAPDNAHIVYCVNQAGSTNLRLFDLSVDPPVDTPLTSDGASCSPVF